MSKYRHLTFTHDFLFRREKNKYIFFFFAEGRKVQTESERCKTWLITFVFHSLRQRKTRCVPKRSQTFGWVWEPERDTEKKKRRMPWAASRVSFARDMSRVSRRIANTPDSFRNDKRNRLRTSSDRMWRRELLSGKRRENSARFTLISQVYPSNAICKITKTIWKLRTCSEVLTLPMQASNWGFPHGKVGLRPISYHAGSQVGGARRAYLQWHVFRTRPGVITHKTAYTIKWAWLFKFHYNQYWY